MKLEGEEDEWDKVQVITVSLVINELAFFVHLDLHRSSYILIIVLNVDLD